MIKKILNSIKGVYKNRFDTLAYRDVLPLAERGRPDAQYALAKMYETGNSAVKQDLINAYVLYAVAAANGMDSASTRMRAIEPMLLAEQYQEANEIIRRLTLVKPSSV